MVVSASQILQFVADAHSKVSFTCLMRHFKATQQTRPKELKGLIAGLIKAGKLNYTSHYGNSFIEISYERPRDVSKHVVLKPPSCSWDALPGQSVVTLAKGTSFGGGEHPTTRLAIQLIDALLYNPYWRDMKPALRAIDIGTGCGVLAIVAAKMGLGFVCGLDTDSCAVFEARENVRLNHLEARVTIFDDDLDAIHGSYDFVFANLRTPTLLGLRSLLEKKVESDAVLIFSGCKTDEKAQICDFYQESGFSTIQTRSEKGWSALCLARGPQWKEKAGRTLWY